MAFSSDFIVAYPGESDDDFQQTLDLIEKIKFASSYSFIYSPRPGTHSSLKHINLVDDKTAEVRLKKKFKAYLIDNKVNLTIIFLIVMRRCFYR